MQLDVTDAGKLYSFGCNGEAQLGLGDENQDRIHTPQVIKLAKSTKIKTLSAGSYHSAYLTGNHDVFSRVYLYCDRRHLHIDTALELIGRETIYIFTESGEVYIWGSGGEGQLGLGSEKHKVVIPTHLPMNDRVVHLSCGYYHTTLVTGGLHQHRYF